MGFYLVRFGLVEDLDKAMKEGPWFIGDQFLSIRPWTPNFIPVNATCKSVAVWARLPQLPIEYYEPSVLKEIGKAIGPVLRIDAQTATESRGRYARICVQVNLDNPLFRTILIGSLAQAVVYEGISTLCFSCGRVGHRSEACPYTIKAPTSECQMDDTDGHPSAQTRSKSPTSNSCNADYGPWTLATRKKAGGKRNQAFSMSPNNSSVQYPGKQGLDGFARIHAENIKWPAWTSTSGAQENKRKSSSSPVIHLASDSMTDSPQSQEVGASFTGVSVLGDIPNLFSYSPKTVQDIKISAGPSSVGTTSKSQALSQNSLAGFNGGGKKGSKKNGKGKANVGTRSSRVGDVLQGQSDHTVQTNHRRDESSTDPHHGLVRNITYGSMGQHFSPHPSEQDSGLSPTLRSGMGAVDKPMVGISNRCPFKGREGDLRMERDAVSIKGANLSRLQSRGHASKEKNVPKGTHCHQSAREKRREEGHSSVPSHSPFQPGHQLEGAPDGNNGACGFIQPGGGIHQEVSCGIGMEYSGADEGFTSD